MARRKPHTQLIDGVPRDPNYDAELFRSSLNFRARSSDVVLFTYPKSGTHWLLYITQCILNGGEGVHTFEEFSDNMRYLGGTDFEEWEPALPLRLFATHVSPRRDTMNEQAKYVYLARNPWDVCVSLFHMVTNFSSYRFQDGTFDEFFDDFLEGDGAGHGSYFDHVASGYALRNEPNVCFLTYEELLKDTEGVVLKLAVFLGERYAAHMGANETILPKILESCTAKKLRGLLVLDFSKPSKALFPCESRKQVTFRQGYEGDHQKYSFVRKGTIGCWKEYFSPGQLRRMEAMIQEVEKRSSVMDLWRDIRQEALAAMQTIERGSL
ncbi:sulfotransferase ssu-1-like [Dermacentor variabilis]|uniref:sulfotransferase ssu-1-like n=1 Tax=Dermacentor variabilis TaxID=34621 RepID=UPI003F5AF8F7